MYGYSALGDQLKLIYLNSWVSDLCGLSCPQGRAVEAGSSAGPLCRHPMALQGPNLLTAELSWLLTKGFITCTFPLSRCITVTSHHKKQATLSPPPMPQDLLLPFFFATIKNHRYEHASMHTHTNTHSHTHYKNKKLNQILLAQYQGQKKRQQQGLCRAKVGY